jgi:hypothetical protein
MQTLSDFLLVPLVVELRQATQHFEPCALADGEADTIVLGEIRHLVESVFQVEVVPAICASDREIDIPVCRTHGPDSSIGVCLTGRGSGCRAG